MSLKECYDKMGADYEDVLSRLRSEVLVRKFALKFLELVCGSTGRSAVRRHPP